MKEAIRKVASGITRRYRAAMYAYYTHRAEVLLQRSRRRLAKGDLNRLVWDRVDRQRLLDKAAHYGRV